MTRTFTDEELRKIIDMLFSHFKKPWILEREFRPYLKAKGYTDEEIDEIWFQALRKGLINIGGTYVGRQREFLISKPPREEEG